MRKLLLKCTGPFRSGKIVDRPNRFILRVRMNSSVERVYFPNPGKLHTVIAPGREVLCKPATIEGRKTNFSAFAVRLSKFYVTVNSSFANTIFSTAVDKGILSEFRGYVISSRERLVPNYGRIDFVLRNTKNRHVYVEVKSCTHVEKGVAKFPDRPTVRGRRHLAILSRLAEKGVRCYVIFIIQRPDAQSFEPFREVDPEFASLLANAARVGVKIMAMTTEFMPPNLYLKREDLPIKFV
ncbi:MAG: DNA/RNA nuclease SfsA [Thaumarchaeota archaeon]|jgi:sugar fermentation stimulation protein A|nr:DNA/RNA nuclease SfsA [Nitrososphaerota archaeon]